MRDADGVARLVDDVVARHGRLDGVVHGAGVLDDRFLADKDAESFARVVATKVAGADALLAATAALDCRVVLFGSVAGVFGNRGQADYAAANDALDGLAHGPPPRPARVVAIDWGPWAGGGHGRRRSSSAEYARRGIGLIEPEEGVAAAPRPGRRPRPAGADRRRAGRPRRLRP